MPRYADPVCVVTAVWQVRYGGLLGLLFSPDPAPSDPNLSANEKKVARLS